MFESIANPKKAEREPWEMLLIGFFYASLAIFIADTIFLHNPVFENYVSILIITFTVMLCIPFMYYIIKLEERKDEDTITEVEAIKQHSKCLTALMFLFLGILIAYTLWFLVLPSSITAKNFHAQVSTYCSINFNSLDSCMDYVEHGITLSKSKITLKEGLNRVAVILSNNLYVLLFVLLFSFMFGAGAIFILTWNASVIASAIGMLAKNVHFAKAFWRYMFHGIPEISAYIIAGLAGGIISVAIIKHEFRSEKFYKVLRDSLDLILLAIFVLIISAFLEVFVTPLLF